MSPLITYVVCIVGRERLKPVELSRQKALPSQFFALTSLKALPRVRLIPELGVSKESQSRDRTAELGVSKEPQNPARRQPAPAQPASKRALSAELSRTLTHVRPSSSLVRSTTSP